MRVIAVKIAMLSLVLGAPSHSANASIVERVAAAIQGGQPLDDLNDMPVISDSTIKANKDLIGCTSKIVQRWSPDFPSIEFICSSPSEKYLRIVSLRVAGEKVEYLSTSPLRMAIGPTREAMERSKIPSRYELFALFMGSIKSGDDLTVGGLVPLTTDQLDALRQLAGYEWKYVTPLSGLGAYFKDRTALVSVEFDSQGRAFLVEIDLNAPRPVTPVGSADNG